jgi:hypothetical protein
MICSPALPSETYLVKKMCEEKEHILSCLAWANR